VEEVNQEPVLEPVAPRIVRIESTLAGKVNLADFQNAVPVVRELAVVNDTERDIRRASASVVRGLFRVVCSISRPDINVVFA
jgi:hypothetical protein